MRAKNACLQPRPGGRKVQMFWISALPELPENHKGVSMSCYLHHVPGRIRIKIPSLKGKHFYAQELEKKLQLISGVHMVSVNSLTGSVLAYYDERAIDVCAITDAVSRETGVDLSSASTPDEYVDKSWSKTGLMVGEKIGKAALGIAIGQLFEGSPLALLAAVI
jgi:hypothetical protein